jgi:hypothetical protein
MNHNASQHRKKTARFLSLLGAAFALGCAFSTATQANAQSLTFPPTPDIITPPPGNSGFLIGRAEGTQGYVCLPTSPGAATASWTVNNARPEATLFAGLGREFQIITHFLSPNTNPNDPATTPPFGNATWQSSFDTSKVWAQVSHGGADFIRAGSDSSCPNTGSIACLLLESVGSQEGPTGGKTMTQVTFIQRLNTQGGSAPAQGCFVAGDVGKQALVPYTADYLFFRKNK